MGRLAFKLDPPTAAATATGEMLNSWVLTVLASGQAVRFKSWRVTVGRPVAIIPSFDRETSGHIANAQNAGEVLTATTASGSAKQVGPVHEVGGVEDE